MLIEAGSWLTLAGADGPEPASMSASAIRTADALTCPTCLLDTPDGYCSCCGATVKSTAPTGTPSREAPAGAEGAQYD